MGMIMAVCTFIYYYGEEIIKGMIKDSERDIDQGGRRGIREGNRLSQYPHTHKYTHNIIILYLYNLHPLHQKTPYSLISGNEWDIDF
jgi:hypothetical protein